MAFVGTAALVGAGASLIPSVFKGISAISQKRKANRINPIDPGYQMNSQVIDNARILGDRYTNYQMPGYGTAQNQIQANASNAYSQGVQGASSSGDILDLVSKINYGTNQASNQLAQQSAMGKEGALKDYLGANVQAGNEYQKLNEYQRQQYEAKLREKAALTQSANENAYGAINDLASAGASLAGGLSSGGRVSPVKNSISPITNAPQIPTTYNPLTIR